VVEGNSCEPPVHGTSLAFFAPGESPQSAVGIYRRENGAAPSPLPYPDFDFGRSPRGAWRVNECKSPDNVRYLENPAEGCFNLIL
jgi:hypothetical protein